jgi:DNA-directed RNA polymerase specialized sigma subunit
VRSLQELAEAYDIPLAEVLEIYSQIALQNPHSLEKRLYSNDDVGQVTTPKDRLEDPSARETRVQEEEKEVLRLTLERMPLKRKLFALLNNLVDLAQDILPDQIELQNFSNMKAPDCVRLLD